MQRIGGKRERGSVRESEEEGTGGAVGDSFFLEPRDGNLDGLDREEIGSGGFCHSDGHREKELTERPTTVMVVSYVPKVIP